MPVDPFLKVKADQKDFAYDGGFKSKIGDSYGGYSNKGGSHWGVGSDVVTTHLSKFILLFCIYQTKCVE